MERKKAKTNKTKIFKFIYGIFFILSTILSGIIWYLGILPTKYFTIFISIYLIMNIFFGICLLKNNKKKSVIKIFTSLLCIILSVGIIFILNYLNSTMNFMDNIKALKYQKENYYLIVLNESEYEKIDDLENKNVGIPINRNDNFEEALNKLIAKVSIDTLEYKKITGLGEDLLNEDIDAIFIDESAYSLINEEIGEFESKTKIIDTISIKVKNIITKKDVDITKKSFNIYISGIDTYGDISSVSRSDVNMIVTVNPNTNQILFTSIPRDYYVRLHETEGYKDKLTHAGLYGVNMSIETIEDLLEIDINYYVRVNFTTLIELVDAIGGVDIYSDKTFTTYNDKNCKIIKGNNYLDGKCALAFARERYAYESGDRHRVQNQQEVLEAIINKALSSSTLITKYTKILNSLENSFQTNMSSDKIYSFINMQLDESPSWNIERISLDGTNSFNYTYTYPTQKLYVMEPNINTIYEAKEKINEVENQL